MTNYSTESAHYSRPTMLRAFRSRKHSGWAFGQNWLLTPKQASGILESVMSSRAYYAAHGAPEGATRLHGYWGESLTNMSI